VSAAPGALPDPVGDRLRALTSQYALPPGAEAHLAHLLAHLAADPNAPTTVRDPTDAVDVHVADSLSGLAVPAIRGAGTIADLGTGAGYPGLVLAAARPEAAVTLVESVGRKCTFLGAAAAAAGIDNAAVACDRAEAWAEGRGDCDVVVCRALAALPVLVEYAAPLLRLGGRPARWPMATTRRPRSASRRLRRSP
jgi:16S rRNA (guanine527-N7)-methyltransferase